MIRAWNGNSAKGTITYPDGRVAEATWRAYGATKDSIRIVEIPKAVPEEEKPEKKKPDDDKIVAAAHF